MKRYALGLLFAGLLTAAAPPPSEPPPIPATPAPVLDLVSVQPYTLTKGAVHRWRAEKPTHRTGYMLVLRVDPALVFPRQIAQPVLYVGKQTAERVNMGHESGYVIAFVPGVTDDPAHPQYIDLAQSRMWFGSPDLPERVDARRIAQEHEAAVKAGIQPFPARKIEDARRKGGALNAEPTKRTLVHDAMRLVLKYSPQERELADGVLRHTK
ncbi:MAG: hypothetical protein GY715_10595 [Planctomycetes bacterium]|nr:hypothetical protein [Planctomycetota bacterium]